MKNQIYQLQLHITNKCNLNCKFCWITNNYQPSADIDDSKWLELSNEIVKLNIPLVTISGGGEPLLRKKLLFQIIKKIKTNPLTHVNLITNGTCLSKDSIQELIDTKLDCIIFSMHSSSPEIDYITRGVDKFLSTINAISNLSKLRTKKKPQITWRSVIFNKNFEEIENLAILACNSGVDIFSLRNVNASPESELQLKKKQRSMLIEKLHKAEEFCLKNNVEFKKEFPDILKYNDKEKKENSKNKSESNLICNIPFNEMVIFANGFCSPCCNFFGNQFNKTVDLDFGSMDSVINKSIIEVWNGDLFDLFRQKIIQKDFPKSCIECKQSLKKSKKNII